MQLGAVPMNTYLFGTCNEKLLKRKYRADWVGSHGNLQPYSVGPTLASSQVWLGTSAYLLGEESSRAITVTAGVNVDVVPDLNVYMNLHIILSGVVQKKT